MKLTLVQLLSTPMEDKTLITQHGLHHQCEYNYIYLKDHGIVSSWHSSDDCISCDTWEALKLNETALATQYTIKGVFEGTVDID